MRHEAEEKGDKREEERRRGESERTKSQRESEEKKDRAGDALTGAGLAPAGVPGLAAADGGALAGGWPCDGLPGFGGRVLSMAVTHLKRWKPAVAPCDPVREPSHHTTVSNNAVANVRWTGSWIGSWTE